MTCLTRNLPSNCLSQASESKDNGLSKFVVVWNEIIKSFRLEDLINNR